MSTVCLHICMQMSLPLVTAALMISGSNLDYKLCNEMVVVMDSRAVDHLLDVNTSMMVEMIFTKIGNFV